MRIPKGAKVVFRRNLAYRGRAGKCWWVMTPTVAYNIAESFGGENMRLLVQAFRKKGTAQAITLTDTKEDARLERTLARHTKGASPQVQFTPIEEALL